MKSFIRDQQTKTNYPIGSQPNVPIRTRSKYTYVIRAKRGETRATKSQMVFVPLLIGWESGAKFLPITDGEMKKINLK